MATIPLSFIAPDIDGLTELRIYESSSSSGPFSLIDTITPVVDDDDNYISEAVTSNAASASDWFAIAWYDGATETDLSSPIKVVASLARVVNGVLLRDPSLNAQIVAEEAEVALYDYFGANWSEAVPTPREMSGLIWMAMARAYISKIVEAASASESYSAGMVSQKTASSSGSGTNYLAMVERFLDFANAELGTNKSVVMQLADFDPTGMGTLSLITIDQSRLVLEQEIR